MPDIKIKVRVRICPSRSHAGPPPWTKWPHADYIPVQLVDTGAPAAKPVSLNETNSSGVTKLSQSLPQATYRVEVPDSDLKATTELDLTAAKDGETLDVLLVPPDGHGLALLKLTEHPAGAAMGGADVRVTSASGAFAKTFKSTPAGRVYATAPAGQVTLEFKPATAPGGGRVIAADSAVRYTVRESEIVEVISIGYWPAIEISAEPTVKTPGGTVPLTDASVTVEYRGGQGVLPTSDTRSLVSGQTKVQFEYAFPGVYVVTVTAPADFGGLPIKAGPAMVTTTALSSGESLPVPAQFELAATKKVEFRVQTPGNLPVNGNLQFQIIGSGSTVHPVTAAGVSFTADVPADESVIIQLDPADVPEVTVPGVGDVPLTMAAHELPVGASPGENTIVLDYLHSITARVVDEHGREVAGAMIDVYDEDQKQVGFTMVTDAQGSFVLGLKQGGDYYLAQNPAGGGVGIRQRVEVHSNGSALVRVQRGTTGGEALTDLSAYPLLTEEITTTGVPAPMTGGPGGGAGAGYGPAVDQVIRDVLGWRPSGDTAAFQAALTGAFQLSEVEGHTVWAWQQRGYAVQADMGALTGAQASIYARAKAALDQIQPLLAGLTTLNPAKYEPQDLETIRKVVGAELQDLVSELSLPGGPRIQRVDQLFSLLTGEDRGSRNMDPDFVRGNLGRLRERFALTVDEIQTVDEERIVTNFRIIVEQVLALQASWHTDRGLLSEVGSRTSLGTILIWLSRALEAICESVDDLSFALDSVYVDAAQRQVIELRLGSGEPPMLLSDLLDWVMRASRYEGPKAIQDAGKDGVLSFAPVLRRVGGLIGHTMTAAARDHRLPPGMRTPRVARALEVLYDQVGEATRLAGLVQVEQEPQVDIASVIGPDVPAPGRLVDVPRGSKTITVEVHGSNFRSGATAILIAVGRQDIPDVPARNRRVLPPTTIRAVFPNPVSVPGGAGATWAVLVTNEDGTQSAEVPL